MKISNFVNRASIVALAVAAAAFVSGCEDGHGGGGSGDSVVGTWAVSEPSGSGTTWWVFDGGGTFVMYDDSALTSEHLSGTFSQDGNKVTGPFTNPGVGDGELDATISDDGQTMQIDFIEHWHSPYKHNALVGTRL